MTDSKHPRPPREGINVTILLPLDEYKLARDHAIRLNIPFKELLRRWITPHVKTLQEVEQLKGGG